MIFGEAPFGAVPFGSESESGLSPTVITVTQAEITLTSGNVSVSGYNIFVVEAPGTVALSSGIVLVSGVNAIVVDSSLDQLYLSGGSPVRIGSKIAISGAGITISAGTVAVGSSITPSAAQIALTSGQPTVASLLEVTGGEITFSAGDPIVGTGLVPATSEIAFSSGTTTIGDALAPVAGTITLSAGAVVLGDGIAPDVGVIAFSGGTVVLADGIRVPSATIWFSGGIVAELLETPQGTVVVLNANTLAASEYSIDALDVVSHDGELYFVLAAGLVKLVDPGTAGADTDFTAAVQTGALYLAGNKIGVVPRAYVGAKTSAALQLTVSTYSYGATLANEYTAPVPVASTRRVQVVPLGKGAEAEAWQFKIDSVAPGARWDLASLEVVVSPIKRPRS